MVSEVIEGGTIENVFDALWVPDATVIAGKGVEVRFDMGMG